MKRIPAMLALATLGAAASAHAALPRTLDGSWYNPLQSGHGLTIERIDHDSALLFWHVFDPAGRPLTLYIETAIDGDTMKGEVLAPSGMRFGRFEESELALPFWGKVELAFADCTHATLKYDSPLAGYGQGEIPLTRLLPASEDCSLRAPAGLATLAGRSVTGALAGEYGTRPPAHWFADFDYGGTLEGFVTDDGGLALHGHDANPEADHFVLVATPVAAAAGEAKLQVRVFSDDWLEAALGFEGGLFPPGRVDQFALQLQTRVSRAGGVLLPRESIAPGEPDGLVKVTPGSTGEGSLRPGIYPFSIDLPPHANPRTFRLEVDTDLTLCVRPQVEPQSGPLPVPVPGCLFTGRASNGSKHFLFELSNASGTSVFTGAGQARYCQPAQLLCDHSLRMIGDDGRTGMSLIGRVYLP
jgi:hypothetical protein